VRPNEFATSTTFPRELLQVTCDLFAVAGAHAVLSGLLGEKVISQPEAKF
jgi:hypothetical protein